MTPKQFVAYVIATLRAEYPGEDRAVYEDCAKVRLDDEYPQELYRASERGSRVPDLVLDRIDAGLRLKLTKHFPDLYRGYIPRSVRLQHAQSRREWITAARRGRAAAEKVA